MEDLNEVEIAPTITTASPGTPSNAPGWTLTEAEVTPTISTADVRGTPPATDPVP
jgi:hypothetical protein